VRDLSIHQIIARNKLLEQCHEEDREPPVINEIHPALQESAQKANNGTSRPKRRKESVLQPYVDIPEIKEA
jgi:hypothetical protein